MQVLVNFLRLKVEAVPAYIDRAFHSGNCSTWNNSFQGVLFLGCNDSENCSTWNIFLPRFSAFIRPGPFECRE